jgi:hypothetical protein
MKIQHAPPPSHALRSVPVQVACAMAQFHSFGTTNTRSVAIAAVMIAFPGDATRFFSASRNLSAGEMPGAGVSAPAREDGAAVTRHPAAEAAGCRD